MTDRRFILDTEENRRFLKEKQDELLSFAHRYPSPGGSTWYLGDDGTPLEEYNRATYESARMVYCYAMGKMLGFPGAEELCKAGLKGLTDELRDKEYGGWYASIAQDGTPVTAKEAYAHAFVILAAATCKLAGIEGAEALLKDAVDTFYGKFWEYDRGLVCDSWNGSFTERSTYRGLNANMHTVEALLAAADATGDEKFRRDAEGIIRTVVGWARANEWRIPEHYSENWEPQSEYNADHPDDQFKPYGATPGHGMEWARLITQWAMSTGDEEIKKEFVAAAESLYTRAACDGWNADGAEGFVYTTDWQGKPVVRDRMHWVLAEGINTSAVLYRVTGNEKYEREYETYMTYLDRYILDHVNGSWFHQLDTENRVNGSVWPGKPDIYHAMQAMMIPYAPAAMSIGYAIKKGCMTRDNI